MLVRCLSEAPVDPMTTNRIRRRLLFARHALKRIAFFNAEACSFAQPKGQGQEWLLNWEMKVNND